VADLDAFFWKLVYAAVGGEEPVRRGSATFPRADFNAAVRLLREGKGPAEVERKTGIHRNRVAGIRDRYVSPRPDSPEALTGETGSAPEADVRSP
jgi:hypothetical protein